MGFGYDTYVSEETAETKGKNTREKILMNTLILNDEQIEKYSDIMTEAETDVFGSDKDDYIRACLRKRRNCSESFTFDSKGFQSKITLDKSQLVFFSVPYSKGWTAEVNGQPADVERVSYGFMAVKAEEGANTITFRYETPGFKTGLIISSAGAASLVVLLIIFRFTDKKNKNNRIFHSYDYNSCQKITAAELYVRGCAKNKEEK